MKNKVKQWFSGLLFNTGLLNASRYVRCVLLKKPCLTILCYHRITDQLFLLAPQCITPEAFEQQLIFFKKHYEIWSLDEVSDYLDGKKQLRRDAVSFTFDDGYADNYDIAHNLLLKANITAAFFISATPLLDRKPYWLDEMAHALSHLDHLCQDELMLLQDPIKPLLSHYVMAAQNNKRSAAKSIFLFLNQLSEAEKKASLATLKQLAKIPGPPQQVAETKLMAVSQALEMQQAGHSIAAHTMTHPKLANLNQEELGAEIINSINLLRERGFSIRHFAYPFGKMSDIGEDTALIKTQLKEQTISMAFTTVDRAVQQQDDRYFIPRKVISPQSIPQINLKLEMLAWIKNPH